MIVRDRPEGTLLLLLKHVKPPPEGSHIEANGGDVDLRLRVTHLKIGQAIEHLLLKGSIPRRMGASRLRRRRSLENMVGVWPPKIGSGESQGIVGVNQHACG